MCFYGPVFVMLLWDGEGVYVCVSVHPAGCDGYLQFSGVKIHWPWLRIQVGLQVPTPIY